MVGACHKCNFIEYRDPDQSRSWFIKTRGVVLYLELVELSKQSFTPTVEFLEMIIDKYDKEKEALKL